MNDDESFLRALQASPKDTTLRLVYADWLEERGDPRGEYLRLEQQVEPDPGHLERLADQLDPAWLFAIGSKHVKLCLRVVRGVRQGDEFPIYPDLNFIGRSDEKPVDIDIEDQEPPDRIWTSRQHAVITWDNGALTIEDLNSANGTFVNRTRVYPGQKRPLALNDVIQIGTVQLVVLPVKGGS
jgi:uncharacterized protein (TIGR02996 family)